MNPNLLNDGVPIDNQMTKDWCAISNEKPFISEIEGYCYMIKFIEKQGSWLNLSSDKSDLVKAYKNQDSHWHTWLDIFNEQSVQLL